MFKKTMVLILAVLGVLLSSFSFAQEQPAPPPENLEKVKEISKRTLETIIKKLQVILEKIWREKVLPICQKMYDWLFSKTWSKIKAWFKRNFESITKEEIEKRKLVIKEEFEKEKEEIKKEIKEKNIFKSIQSLWEKLKELIK